MRGLRRQIVLSYGLIILLTVLLLEGIFNLAVRQYYYNGATTTLKNSIAVSSSFYNRYAGDYELEDRARYIFENKPEEAYATVEVIDANGVCILNDSGVRSGKKITAPDVEQAIRTGEESTFIGRDPATGVRILAVSHPLLIDRQTVGILRYSSSVEALDAELASIHRWALVLGGLVVLLVIAVSLILARGLVRPIKELTGAARHMAQGDFSVRAPVERSDELGTLAVTFNHLAQEVQRNERLQNEFIASISHELRTPLTSIKGWSETLLTGDPDKQEETRQGLKIIYKETDRMILLVEELLDFSRYKAGKMELYRERFAIARLLAELREQFHIRAREKNIDLQIDEPLPHLLINGDYNRLKQVLLNLLDNALKFTAPGGNVDISSSRQDDALLLQIQDNGIGIKEEDLPRVTQQFYKGESREAGSGLGLSIAREIVILHGGDLTVQSIPGQGTTVSVRLPLDSAHAG